MTWSYYVCRNAAGRWSVVRSKYATMPPWEAVDGPYLHEAAIHVAKERNKHRAKRLHREEFRTDLL